jgi:hypothetical protein
LPRKIIREMCRRIIWLSPAAAVVVADVAAVVEPVDIKRTL